MPWGLPAAVPLRGAMFGTLIFAHQQLLNMLQHTFCGGLAGCSLMRREGKAVARLCADRRASADRQSAPRTGSHQQQPHTAGRVCWQATGCHPGVGPAKCLRQSDCAPCMPCERWQGLAQHPAGPRLAKCLVAMKLPLGGQEGADEPHLQLPWKQLQPQPAQITQQAVQVPHALDSDRSCSAGESAPPAGSTPTLLCMRSIQLLA